MYPPRLLALLALLTPSLAATPVGSSPVEISEFLARNSGSLTDEDGDSSDWIELQSTSATAINLAGYFLTDDPLLPTKWAFPSTALAAGGRLVVFASGKDRAVSGSPLHTNFSLSGDGEYLALVDPNGTTILTEFAPEYPNQVDDVSYGSGLDLQGQPATGYFVPPTPGNVNGVVVELLPDVQFSIPRGVYDTTFPLSLLCDYPGGQIRYTLDGSAPKASTGSVYTGPLTISKTTIVRAACFAPGLASLTTVVTSSYIFPADVLTQTDASAIAAGFPATWNENDGTPWTSGSGGTHPGASYGMDPVTLGNFTPEEITDGLLALPIVSLSMSIDDWFGTGAGGTPFGVYVNSQLSGDNWTRSGSAEWIEPDGGPGFQINCGLGVQGGSSTGEELRSQLSLDLKFQAEYGPTKLDFPLFPDSSVESFDYLILDAGNQNSIHSKGNLTTKKHAQGIRDLYMMDLQRAMGGDTAVGRHVNVYLNGLYWGLYTLHERPDHRWAEAHYGGEKEEYDFVKEGNVFEGNQNPASHPFAPGAWKVAIDIAESGLADSDTYNGQPALDALREYINLESYVDYLILNYYGANTDWPQRNWMATSHSRIGPLLTDENPDLEFRFHSWDAEDVLHWGTAVTQVGGFYDRTLLTSTWNGNAVFLHTELLANSDYPIFFADRAHKHLFNDGALFVDRNYSSPGTPFDPNHPERNRPASVYEPLATSIEPAIPLAFARWANYWDSPIDFQPELWYEERDRILEDYMPVRSDALLAQLVNAGLYPQVDAPKFDQHGGNVPAGYSLTMTGPAGGTIYYTLDGGDPRSSGGAVAPGALVYGGSVPLSGSVPVNARTLSGGAWSAVNSATFLVAVDVRISEFMADNTLTATDEAGQFEDWIEVANFSAQSVDMSTAYLSDTPLEPTLWKFPDGTVIDPGERLLVWADSDPQDGPLHADFKLSKSGEQILLSLNTPDGLVTLDEISFGPQATDVSSGLLPEQGPLQFGIFDPSPGAPNLPGPGQTVRYDLLSAAQNTMSLQGTPPIAGGVLTFSIQNAPPADVGLVALGATPIQFNVSPSTTLLLLPAAAPVWQLFFTDAGGVASAKLGLPTISTLVGLPFYTQAAVDSGPFSNGMAFAIGN